MENVICPLLSNPKVKQEFEKLKEMVGENVAYYCWNESKGEGLQQALAVLGSADNSTPLYPIQRQNYLGNLNQLESADFAPYEENAKNMASEILGDKSQEKADIVSQFKVFYDQVHRMTEFEQYAKLDKKIYRPQGEFSLHSRDGVPKWLTYKYTSPEDAEREMYTHGINYISFAKHDRFDGKWSITFKSRKILNTIWGNFYKLFKTTVNNERLSEVSRVKNVYFKDSDVTDGKTVLKNIIKQYRWFNANGRNSSLNFGKQYSEYAVYLLSKCGKLLSDVKVVYLKDQSVFTDKSGDIHSAKYSSENNTVYINSQAAINTSDGRIESTLLHELTHAVTAQYIELAKGQEHDNICSILRNTYSDLVQRYLTYPQIKELLEQNKIQISQDNIDDVTQFLSEYTTEYGDKPYYWMKSEHELLSEFWSNPVFAMQLKNTDYTLNNNFLDRVKQIITRILRAFDINLYTNNAFSQSLAILDSIIDQYETYAAEHGTQTNLVQDLYAQASDKVDEIQSRLSKKIEDAAKKLLIFTDFTRGSRSYITEVVQLVCKELAFSNEIGNDLHKAIGKSMEDFYNTVDFYINQLKSFYKEQKIQLLADIESIRYNPYAQYIMFNDFLNFKDVDKINEYYAIQQALIKEKYGVLWEVKDPVKRTRLFYKFKSQLRKPQKYDYEQAKLKKLAVISKLNKINALLSFTEVVPNYKNIIRKFIFTAIKHAKKPNPAQYTKKVTLNDFFDISNHNFDYLITQTSPTQLGTILYMESKASEILDRISKLDPKVANTKIVKLLQKYVKNNDVKVKIVQAVQDTTTKGTYNTIANEITIILNQQDLSADGISIFYHTFCHELVHAITIATLNTNHELREAMEQYFEYAKKESLRNGGLFEDHYGFTNVNEFVAEFFTSSSFQRHLKKLPAMDNKQFKSLFEQILDKIIRFFLPKKSVYYQIKPVIERIIELSDETSEKGLFENIVKTAEFNELHFYAPQSFDKLREKSAALSADIKSKLKNRLDSVRYRKGSLSLVNKILQQIDKYESLLQNADDISVICDFIDEVFNITKKTDDYFAFATQNQQTIDSATLNVIKSEILDFYKPLISQINSTLLSQDFLELSGEFSPEEIYKIKQRVLQILVLFDKITGSYKNFLFDSVANLLRETCKKYNYSQDAVEEYIRDNLNSTANDMSILRRLLQSTKGSDDILLQITAKMMQDINNSVKRFTTNYAQDVIKQLSKIKQSQIELFFERDASGNITGNLIRPLNYGQFYSEYTQFLDTLNEKYNIDSNTYMLLPQDLYEAYVREKEDWLSTHCERKYINQYYVEYNKLPKFVTQRLNMLQAQIDEILDKCTDTYGKIHLEKLSKKQFQLVDQLFMQKRNMSNIYDTSGSVKTGEEYTAAIALQQFYKSLEPYQYSQNEYDDSDVRKLISQKQKELSDNEFKLWFSRNIKISVDPSFFDSIQSTPRNYGSDTKTYQDLLEERRALLQLGKHTNSTAPDASLYSESVKERIRKIDSLMKAIREAHPESKSLSPNQFSFMPTAQYKNDEELARNAGDEEYNRWYSENHLNGRPYSYYIVILPNDNNKHYIKYSFSPLSKEPIRSSRLLNPNYDINNKEKYQPKKGLYDNSEAYKKATATQQQKEVYDFVVKSISDTNKKINFLSGDRSYILPQITGSIVDRLFRSGSFFKGLKSVIEDLYLIRNDDEQFNTSEIKQNPDGSEINFIPTHYLGRLRNPNTISRNLQKMLILYAKMGENFKQKQNVKSTFEIIKNILSEREYKKHGIVGNKTVNGIETNNYKKLDSFLKMQLYGKYTEPLTIKKNENGEYYSITKIFQATRSYGTASNLANNIPAIAKALLQGLHKSVVEGFAKRYYNINDYAVALFHQILKIPEMLLNLGNTRHSDLTLLIMEQMQIGTDINAKTLSLNRNRFVRIFTKHLLWGGWSAVDYFVKAPVVRAIMSDYKYIPEFNEIMSSRQYVLRRSQQSNTQEDYKKYKSEFTKINSFNLNDVFYVKDGKLSIKQQYSKYVQENVLNSKILDSVTNTARFITNRIDGVLSQEDKTSLMTNCFGALLFMHRSFFINNLEDNFLLQQQYNPTIEDTVEAKYLSCWRGLQAFFKNFIVDIKYALDSENRKKHKSGLKDFQIYNIKRTLIQLGLVALYTFISGSVLDEWRNEEEPYSKQLTGYSISGMAFEERAEYNPWDFLNQIKSPSAAINSVDNFTNLYKTIIPLYWDYMYNEEINSGPYVDQTRAMRTVIRSIPGLRGAWESQDIIGKWNYLNNNLDTTRKEIFGSDE